MLKKLHFRRCHKKLVVNFAFFAFTKFDNFEFQERFLNQNVQKIRTLVQMTQPASDLIKSATAKKIVLVVKMKKIVVSIGVHMELNNYDTVK